MSDEISLYAILGEAGVAALVAAFYRRVATDDLLRPMYPEDDLAGAEERLRDFLVFRMGGPRRYLDTRGHPRLRMRHQPFAIDIAARDRWLALMEEAMAEVGLVAPLVDALRPYFQQTAEAMRNR